ncbi:MAG: ATPase domain-containing protein [Candidatus Heimdallarchaeota archaeon]
MNSLLNPPELESLIFGQKLSSGYQGNLIHIFGEAGTGKTIMALQIAIAVCLQGKRVVVIDTEGKMSGEKIQLIAGSENLTRTNKYLKLYCPNKFDEQHELIERLDFYLKNQEIGLIVIDTITNLYRQEMMFKKNNKSAFEKLAYQIAFLRRLSRERNIPVLIFNQATMLQPSDKDPLILMRERVNPVAKAIMRYWSDREIIFVKHGWGKFEARIPSEFEGRVLFGISNNGIIPLEE